MLYNRNVSQTIQSSRDYLYISDQAIVIYNWLVLTMICQVLNVFGIFTNIINIICFVKQGFKDPVNITLLGLSVSDLGSLITMLWTCICLTPPVMSADLPFDPMDVVYLINVPLHHSFARVSSCITAMITLERCMCITMPLKVKNIVTRRRTTFAIISVFTVFLCSTAPVYFVNKLDMKFSPVRNKTIVGLVFMGDRENVEKISFATNDFAIPFGAFFIIVVCTTLILIQLRKIAKWRSETLNVKQHDDVSIRNQKTGRMVVMISTLFIVCFVPICIAMIAIAFVPALSIDGKYINISIIMFGLGCTLESVNSSMNIFIYYSMSSNYRLNFRRLFNWTQ